MILNTLQLKLSDMFPNIEGLQNTVLGSYLPPKFQALKLADHGVQILNLKNMHWVCVKFEKITHKTARMTVADGLGYPVMEIMSQASSMLRGTQIDEIEVVQLYPQKQLNGHDCGPMAAVFAYMFCANIDPNSKIFDSHSIRNLVTKVAMDKETFQAIEFLDKIEIIEPKVNILPICYCTCRSSAKEGLKFCIECLEYFHVSCRLVFDSVCKNCRENKIDVDELSEVDSSSQNSDEAQDMNEKIQNLEDTSVEFYKTKHGKTGVFFGGYAFYLKRENKFSSVYICRERNCKSILKVLDGIAIENEDLHDHGMDEVYIERRKTLNEMKRRAKETLDPIPTIYSECLNELHSRDEISASEFPPLEYFIRIFSTFIINRKLGSKHTM